ncbi:multidrug resistance-associated protein 1-like isoform X2 [Bradysia coprophila]|uniref:multidrug resistance-associated protein 1-like isoform X2 n=1 Tax=Bradysia coprophila TaxID=38358 RepID=UPI00187DA904|nr:multidrug resistance-associated protein 1-like isoform X2 [Bradysia coprophila]
MEEFCGSEFWNSNLTWYTDDPDFTVCFQRTVLVWVPCLLLWMFFWVDIFYIKRSLNRNIPWGILNVSKLLFTGALILLTIVDLCVAKRYVNSMHSIPADKYTLAIKILTFILSSLIVYLNKRYGRQTSGVLFFFWLFLLLFSIPQCRSEIRRRGEEIKSTWDEYNFVSFMIFFTITTIELFLNCLADEEPLESKYPRTQNSCPEMSCNFVSKLLFAWFDKMAWKGYKAPLKQDDLWDLKPEDTTTEIISVFTKHWNTALESSIKKSMKSSKNKHTQSIVPVMWKSFGGSFLFATSLKLAEDFLLFVAPQLLGLTIDFVDSSKSDDRPELWKGFMYAALLFAVASVQTLIFTHFYHQMYMVGFRIRTALIGAIYRKALVVSNATRKESTVGEITNLMSIDADRFTDLLLYINLVWSAPLQIGIAMYFLWSILGVSVLAGLAVMILSMPVTGIILNMLRKLYTKQMANKDERIKMMNEILNGIKVLKLYAWENSFQSHVNRIRDKEVKTLRRTAFLDSSAYLIWATVPFIVSLLTFGVFVLIDEKNVLTPQIAFVALNLFNIIRFPLVMLPDLVSNFVEAKVSVQRINKFLNSEELDADSIEHYDQERAPLVMETASFSWGGKEPLLSDISIRVQTGELVAVVGSVGSGKSSLLSAFLGEMNRLSGRINTVGRIAYVPQQAWIQNCTLQDNILFGKPLDQQRYLEVIRSCALKPDLEMLPAGDQTEIGEKGINLSGGQKQRISLARSVYNDADIYFLDDPLSAVDAHVGLHIFEQVIGPSGLLASKTRIMVTHAMKYLPKMDNVIVLKSGKISESGSYADLMRKKGAFAEFLLQHVQETSMDGEDMEILKDQMEIDEEIVRKLERSRSQTSENRVGAKFGSQTLSRQSSDASDTSMPSTTVSKINQKFIPETKDTLIVEEQLQVGSVKYDVYKHYVKNVGIKWMVLMLMANVVFQSVSIGSNMWLTIWSSDSEAATDTQRRDMYLGVYGAFGLFIGISGYLLDLSPRLGGLAAGMRLHRTLLHSILHAPLSFFETTPTGRILSRFAKDIDAVDNRLPQVVSDVFGLGFEVLATVVVISMSTYMFLVVIIPIALMYYILQRIYIATSRQLKRLESISRSPIYSHFGETLQGAHTIRAYAVGKRFIKESDLRVNTNQTSEFASIVANRWLGIRLETVANLIILFAALFAVWNRDTISAGMAGLSIAYSLQITEGLNWLVRSISTLETESVSVERVKEYSQVTSEAQWTITPQLLPKNWPEFGRVQFNNFQVRYRDGLELVLRGISFEINSGEKVGIVGRTGAGKSSLTLALFRIIEGAGGSIVIDGHDISKLGLQDLRSRLTIIPQDPVLFSGTLRLNLDPFEQNSDAEIWTALEHSHLKSFVEELTAGLNHEITEGGDNLSVGQRQLLCLSRALLRKTKVLILDEATAAVDLETDDLIQKTIRTEFNDCTILTIAHRLNTIIDSDKVLVLDRGQVMEFAPPTELLQNKTVIFF